MRFLAIAISVIGIIVSSSVGAVAASTTGGGCFGPGQCRTVGRGADAFWSGVPDSGPVPGVAYTDTSVSASVQSMRGGGVSSSGAGLWFDRSVYTFDANLDWVPISDTYVVADGADLRVTVAPNLGTAAAAGSVTVVTCTYDAAGNPTCSDPVGTTVTIQWTAFGARLMTDSTYHAKGYGATSNSIFHGMQRMATATGSVGGVAVSGTPGWADINDSRSNSVWICHGASC